MYLLDANVFITAHQRHYPFGVFPGVWEWLGAALADGTVGSIARVRDELTTKDDELQRWVTGRVGLDLAPDDDVVDALREVAAWTMAQDRFLPAAKVEFLDIADYFLVGHAIAGEHVVVTNEVAQPEGRRRVKIPDVCDAFGVQWIAPIEMLRREGARFVLTTSP